MNTLQYSMNTFQIPAPALPWLTRVHGGQDPGQSGQEWQDQVLLVMEVEPSENLDCPELIKAFEDKLKAKKEQVENFSGHHL